MNTICPKLGIIMTTMRMTTKMTMAAVVRVVVVVRVAEKAMTMMTPPPPTTTKTRQEWSLSPIRATHFKIIVEKY